MGEKGDKRKTLLTKIFVEHEYVLSIKKINEGCGFYKFHWLYACTFKKVYLETLEANVLL